MWLKEERRNRKLFPTRQMDARPEEMHLHSQSPHTEWRKDRRRGEGKGEVQHVWFLSGGVRTLPSLDLREPCQISMMPDCQVIQAVVLYMCHMCFIRVRIHTHTHTYAPHDVVWDAVIGLYLRHPHRCVHHHSRMLSSTWAAHERCEQLCGDLIANVNCELRRANESVSTQEYIWNHVDPQLYHDWIDINYFCWWIHYPIRNKDAKFVCFFMITKAMSTSLG